MTFIPSSPSGGTGLQRDGVNLYFSGSSGSAKVRPISSAMTRAKETGSSVKGVYGEILVMMIHAGSPPISLA